MITYKRGNMFAGAPEGSILAHACNCYATWGSGVAAEFAELFEYSHRRYVEDCEKFGALLLGQATTYLEPSGDTVACLFTSRGFGPDVDSEKTIVLATELALTNLLAKVGPNVEIHMPKINSGLFRVPWEKTEAVLKRLDGNFVVWCLE